MSKINDGGPAFPHPVNKHAVGMQYAIVDGMSLLDWFAGQALEEFEMRMLRERYFSTRGGDHGDDRVSPQTLRYFHAEQMLAARKVAKSEPDWLSIVTALLDIIHDDLTHERQAAHAAALTAARRAVGRA